MKTGKKQKASTEDSIKTEGECDRVENLNRKGNHEMRVALYLSISCFVFKDTALEEK